MSRIDELIQQLCPDGVEYKNLNEVLTIKNGRDYKHLGEGNVPVYGSGGIMAYTNTAAYDKPSVLIPRKGSLNKLYYVDEPFWNVDTIFYTDINCEIIVPKYVYYWLAQQHIEKLNKAGGVPSLTQGILNKVIVPVPPLPVQEEIVRILDKFSALEAELEAELEARCKQYEFYRDQLLTFGDEVEWKPLGEVFDTRNGYTPSKSQEEYWLNGTIPWFRMEDIRLHGRVLADSIQHVTPCAIKGGKLFPAYSIILGTTATIGEHALVTIECLSNQQMTNLAIKEEYSKFLNIKFFFYYCFILGEWCKKNINAGNFALLDVSKLKKRLIPIPPLAEQERIVAILDKFDALVNDISSGLPAELEMRRKQYEYYRDRLLTFPKKKA